MIIKFRPSNQVKNTTECVSARNPRQRGVCFRSAGLTSWAQDSTSCLYYCTWPNNPSISPSADLAFNPKASECEARLWCLKHFPLPLFSPAAATGVVSLTNSPGTLHRTEKVPCVQFYPTPDPWVSVITCSHLPAQPACGLFLDPWLHSCLWSFRRKCVDQATRLP